MTVVATGVAQAGEYVSWEHMLLINILTARTASLAITIFARDWFQLWIAVAPIVFFVGNSAVLSYFLVSRKINK